MIIKKVEVRIATVFIQNIITVIFFLSFSFFCLYVINKRHSIHFSFSFVRTGFFFMASLCIEFFFNNSSLLFDSTLVLFRFYMKKRKKYENPSSIFTANEVIISICFFFRFATSRVFFSYLDWIEME